MPEVDQQINTMTRTRRVFGRRRFTDRDGVAMTIEMREDGVWGGNDVGAGLR